MHVKIGLLHLTASLLLVACGDSASESAGGSTTESVTTTDEGSDTAAPGTTDEGTDTGAPVTTGDVPTTGSEPPNTTGDDTGDDAGDDAGDDTGRADDSTAGEPDHTTGDEPAPIDPDIVEACAAYCQRWAECGVVLDPVGCVPGCADSIGPVEGACKAAHEAQLACVVGLECDQLPDSVGDGGLCAEAVAAIDQACGGGGGRECVLGVSSDSDEQCGLDIDCLEGDDRSMICDGAVCSCFEGERQVGECAANDACSNVDGLAAKSAACCGF